MKTIALIGNPNCGKSTLFNALTGGNERVGNWSGVTMERAEGVASFQTKAKGVGEGVGEEAGRNEAGMARTMRRHFPKGFHQAFSYLLFILLYVPCLGATAVVFKEIGKLYGAIFVVYMTALGWSVATIYHALAVSHSLPMLAAGVATILAMFGFFAFFGRRHRVDLTSAFPR